MSKGQDPESRDSRINRSALSGALEIVSVFAVAGLVLVGGLTLVGDDPLRFQGLVWVANVCMLGAVWLNLRRRGEGWSAIGLARGPFSGRGLWRAVWKSVLVFAAAMLAFGLGAVVMAMVLGRPEPADMSGYSYLSGNLPMLAIALIGVFIASSLGEEVVYRGFLITRLESLGGGGKASTRVAVVVSSVIFGLIHFAWGPMGIVQTFFMGLALAVSFLRLKRNLWIVVLAHFYMDAILLVQMYLAPQ